ncbi:MAG TPA: Rossmann-like and DUF2520 domain-containing protein [Longimicrobiaceae bacterium]|nr:Rossmann-like and DUF2520 domain-containing protein [Longimicrobiaceae bacterium]
MTRPDGFGTLWIVGPGRLGLALGSQLAFTGKVDTLIFVGKSALAPPHPIFATHSACYVGAGEVPDPLPDVILVTVPDDSIEGAADWIGGLSLPPGTVLHTSGAHGKEVLQRLAFQGWSTGSIHPLVAIPEPIASAKKLRGAWYGIEGTPEAVGVAEAIVAALEGRGLRVQAGEKAAYHAAAVFGSNYVVTLLEVALRLANGAGVDPDDGLAALVSLARGALDDVARLGPREALTGPVARGDVDTVALHLARLSEGERTLYSVLAREAVEIARRRGLPQAAVSRLGATLDTSGS